MKYKADNLISDLASTVAFYEKARREDRDLGELHRIAEAALGMLVIIRQHQLQREAEDSGSSLID